MGQPQAWVRAGLAVPLRQMAAAEQPQGCGWVALELPPWQMGAGAQPQE